MGKAEFKWTINKTHYHLYRHRIDLGNGKQSKREVWELAVKIGDRWDAKWQQTSKRGAGATRDEILQLLADMFDRDKEDMEPLVEAAEENGQAEHEKYSHRVDPGAPVRRGLPTQPLPERF
jgi:hypothetical protein